MKSILFQLGTWTVGGVERVTVVLANEFARRGWRVTISAYKIEDAMLLRELRGVEKVDGVAKGEKGNVEIVELAGGLTAENAAKLHEVLVRREVSIVINQWCVNFRHSQFLRKAMAGTDAKLIAVHHNRPDMNNRIMTARNPLLKWLWRRITAWSLRKVYGVSDKYVLLSPGFTDIFRKFTGVRDASRVIAIPNPVTIQGEKVRGEGERRKENVLLYVGRLEETQKRVSRIIEVWRAVCDEHPDWRLEIVGDGPDRARYEAQAANLPRIHFAGVQSPAQYYERAKILLLTSDFEGFPLVLCEAMSFGCVPVALGSYAAAYDVLGREDRCGAVMPTPWNVDLCRRRLRELMADDVRLCGCSKAAKERAKDFSVASVVDAYVSLASELECGEI